MELVCSYRPIVDYIDTQFENYLQEELKIRRSLFDYHDTRIHVCLYFITPTGHSLKSLDLVTMKKLDSKVDQSLEPCGSGLYPLSSSYIVCFFWCLVNTRWSSGASPILCLGNHSWIVQWWVSHPVFLHAKHGEFSLWP